MSNEPLQNPLETLHSLTEETIEGAIKEAIEEAHLLLATLEDQIKLGFFTGSTATEITPSDEQPSPLEDDSFRTDWR